MRHVLGWPRHLVNVIPFLTRRPGARYTARHLALVCGTALLLFAPDALAVQLELIVAGLSSPVYVTHAADGNGRLFIVEQAGTIQLFAAGGGTPTVFLDIADRVLAGGERGLLGLAFHPQYAVNGRFFVNYTRKPDGATVIAEYRRSANLSVALRTETILLTMGQPFANHNGGMIAFGPDGFLYIGMGDGGSANDPDSRAQNINDLLGKILRIDVDGARPYEIPPDNPFAGPTPGRDEIYAMGLRNPFRFSFDRATGELLVGDVGQGMWEEIDVVTRGANLGWRVFEGNRCTNLDPLCASGGFTPPVAEYSHAGGRCSVTGGYAYRGTRGTLPAGTYVFGDFCSGEILRLVGSTPTLLLDTTLNVSSFGEDESGEIYVVGLEGTVHRLVADASGPCVGQGIDRAGDFDGSCTADILWRHISGALALWLMNGPSIAATGLPGAADAAWSVQGVGDFDGDGRTDILWRHTTGAVIVWLMDGARVSATGSPGSADPAWSVQGVGDFNGDDRADILWRHISGALALWLMNGPSIGAIGLPGGADAAWSVQGVGDFDGDGRTDILWRHTTGAVIVWLMDGARVGATGSPGSADPAWSVQGVGDFNGDDRADILWRHISGALALWLMNGPSIAATGLPGAADAAWSVQGVGDFDGDGRTDILWRDPSGALILWLMEGARIASLASLGRVALDWVIQ